MNNFITPYVQQYAQLLQKRSLKLVLSSSLYYFDLMMKKLSQVI